jgi:hypothetical protein
MGVTYIKSSLTSAGIHIEDEVEITPALAKLEKRHKPSFTCLYLTWSHVCLAECKDLNDYIDTFDGLYHELQDPEYEYSLPRIELLLKFVNGLGPEPEWESCRKDLFAKHDFYEVGGMSLEHVKECVRMRKTLMENSKRRELENIKNQEQRRNRGGVQKKTGSARRARQKSRR